MRKQTFGRKRIGEVPVGGAGGGEEKGRRRAKGNRIAATKRVCKQWP